MKDSVNIMAEDDAKLWKIEQVFPTPPPAPYRKLWNFSNK